MNIKVNCIGGQCTGAPKDEKVGHRDPTVDELKAALRDMASEEFKEYFEEAIDDDESYWELDSDAGVLSVHVPVNREWGEGYEAVEDLLVKKASGPLKYLDFKEVDGSDDYMSVELEFNVYPVADESKQDEASSTGNLKGRKKVMDAINRGYIFEALDVAHEVTEAALKEVSEADEALQGCQEKLEKLDDLRTKLNEIGAVALRTSIANLYSPDHARDAARDKMLKDAIKLMYEIFGDLDAGREMVLTYTSSLATNAKRALLQNKNAVEVTMGDLKENGLEGDSKELVTFTRAKSRQADAAMAKALGPVIDQAKVVAEAAGTAADATVPATEYQKLLDKLTEMYENAKKITMVITTTPDFQPSDIIKQLKTAPEESKLDEGFLDKLIDMFKKLASGLGAAFASLKQQFTSLFSDVEEANDVYAKTSELLMTMGFAPISDNLPAEAEPAPSESFSALTAKLGEAFRALEKHPDYCNFADEVYFAQAGLDHVREALVACQSALETLKCAVAQPMNEDNMEVVGILADAITKIANDAEEPTSDDTEEPSVGDRVSQAYNLGSDDFGADREREEEPAGGEPGPEEL